MKIDNTLSNSIQQLSSAKRINSAADDPSGLVISSKMTSQIRGLEKETNNVLTSKDLAKTAEGGLNSIGENLQRIRDLAVQASNGTNTADDKKSIQAEISQLKNNIQDAAKSTEFNTIKVLDGSFTDKNLGTGSPMTIKNTSLETLGVDQFDVTQNFDISTIDKAIAQVNDSKSSLGSFSNQVDRQVSANNIASENLVKAEDQISNANIEKTVSELKKLQLLQNVQIYTQQVKSDQSSSTLNVLR